MKAIDEMIEKYLRLNFNDDVVDINDVINSLEQLKAELKEQHKKDVIEAYHEGRLNCDEGERNEEEQYYKDNH